MVITLSTAVSWQPLPGRSRFQAAGHFVVATGYAITTVPTTLDVSLLPSATPIVQGTVRDSETGQPIGSAFVAFNNTDSALYATGSAPTTTTNVAGDYAFDASQFFESATAGFGSYLTVSAAAHFFPTAPFASYAPPFPITQDILLTSSVGTVLQGTVTDRGTGQPLAGAKVYRHGATNEPLIATTDANGHYSVDGSLLATATGPITFSRLRTLPFITTGYANDHRADNIGCESAAVGNPDRAGNGSRQQRQANRSARPLSPSTTRTQRSTRRAVLRRRRPMSPDTFDAWHLSIRNRRIRKLLTVSAAAYLLGGHPFRNLRPTIPSHSGREPRMERNDAQHHSHDDPGRSGDQSEQD